MLWDVGQMTMVLIERAAKGVCVQAHTDLLHERSLVLLCDG
jgi:hypothetical protein